MYSIHMSTTESGRIGEAKVISALAEQGWYPFVDISGKCPVDIVAWKDGRCITIQVKSSGTSDQYGAYIVQIGRVRPNRTGNTVHKFDNTGTDYLAVYLSALDKVCFIPSSEIMTGRAISMREIDNGKTKYVVDRYALVQ